MAGDKKQDQMKVVESISHFGEKRKNIPTAEYQSVMEKEEQKPVKVVLERPNVLHSEEKENRNRDLDPQLVWRGKDEQDWSDLVVHAPPLYIQEKIHPKVLIEDLRRMKTEPAPEDQPDLFSDFNGIPEDADKTDFYQHEGNWTNRMILGDSLQVMASLAEREGLRGQVQCIYFDPPYGIKFNSNFQWSTTTSQVRDGFRDHITREPETVKAFRDTWKDGIHSYLSYLRDRLTIARDLLTSSGSIFVQISDENLHKVRCLLDEVFGEENFIGQILFKKTGGLTSTHLASVGDYVLWYGKDKSEAKFRQGYIAKSPGDAGATQFKYRLTDEGSFYEIGFEEAATISPSYVVSHDNITSQGNIPYEYVHRGKTYVKGFKPSPSNLSRVDKAGRFCVVGNTPRYLRKLSDFGVYAINQLWSDLSISGFSDPKIYVVQTSTAAIQRCLLMVTDPGDLVLDPTCGSGTTAYVAEQWGRRWITIDTSRVALALARSRVMGARYPYYLLTDSSDGQRKAAEIAGSPVAAKETFGNIRHGFVYERVPHITLKSIANNAEIDVIWEKYQADLELIRSEVNRQLGKSWQEWEIPRDAPEAWNDKAKKLHSAWWEKRIARQKEIDASIAAKADYEYLYDKPYVDNKKVRVAGPFTVESLMPHRVLAMDENDEPFDEGSKAKSSQSTSHERDGFIDMILDNLKTSGVQQAHKEDRITFTALKPWPGRYICAEGVYQEGDRQRRAGIFIGPEFGTVSRPDLVDAAKEAGDADFDVVIACAFNYDAHGSEFDKLGRIPVLKARMNADLHMADDLKNTGKGNLFVIFGEPDIDVIEEGDKLKVKINGVDVFDPRTGEIRSDDAHGIACWFLDTDYNGESFFVRHAYFLGQNDPYKALKTTLKAEIDEDAWSTLNSDVSRLFEKPTSGRVAVKVINHFGDEVMKVFRV